MTGTDNSNKIGRREALARIGAAVAGVAVTPFLSKFAWADGPDAARKPNIVLIVADDMGYGDLGCYGAKDLSTPNLDKLAAQGVKFTQFYCAAPVCAPMRVSFLTGKYPQRTSLPSNPSSKNPEAGLSPDEFTIAEAMKTAGYTTGIIGKWHMGYAPKFWPSKQGFDENFGPLSGWADYIDHTYEKTQNWMYRGDKPDDPPGYLTDVLTKEALSYIQRHKNDQFFLYLPFTAPHGPHVAPDGTRRETRKVYKEIVENYDTNIGKILEALRASGLEDNTVVIFLSDNGSDMMSEPEVGSNGGLRGGKRTVFEGGIRTPFFAKWPGHITPGTVVNEPIMSMDIYRTLTNIAGVTLPATAAIDSVDILDVMQGKGKRPREYMFWNFGGQYAARTGKWKIIEQGGRVVGLYDIEADPAEKIDLSAQQSKVVEDLSIKLAQWKREVGKGKRING